MAHSLEDKLYEKYRVFREPEEAPTHPVDVTAIWHTLAGTTRDLREVDSFTFVLKPDTDRYARIALLTYAALVEEEYPQLAEDLRQALSAY